MSKFSDLFFNKQQSEVPAQIKQNEQRDFFGASLNYSSVTSYVSSQSLRLSAVACATNAISNAVATLPININQIDVNGYKTINYNHSMYSILNNQPCPTLSKHNFFKMIVESIILKGNGYALIVRDATGNVTGLQFVRAEWVTISYNLFNDERTYWITGVKKGIDKKDILHFWQYTSDTVNGLSVINYAVNTLQSSADAEAHSSNFFKSGGSLNGVMKTDGFVDDTQIQQLGSKWRTTFDGVTGGVVVLPKGLEYQPISVNPVDAQMLESRQFNIIEIARFFNISPVKLMDLTHASYSSLEQTQLSFLEDTVKPYLSLIENEINRKIFNQKGVNMSISFDTTSMLSTDKTATANYLKTMVASGLMSINEARKQLGLNEVDNGNELFMQLNMSTVDNLVNQTPAPVQADIQQKTNNLLTEDNQTDTEINK